MELADTLRPGRLKRYFAPQPQRLGVLSGLISNGLLSGYRDIRNQILLFKLSNPEKWGTFYLPSYYFERVFKFYKLIDILQLSFKS